MGGGGRAEAEGPAVLHAGSWRHVGTRAGLWEYWERNGQELWTATIITTAAGPDMEEIHDRQPVVLEPDRWDTWTDPENDDQHELQAMLVASGGVLVHHRVGYDVVGNVKNDSPELVKPAEAE